MYNTKEPIAVLHRIMLGITIVSILSIGYNMLNIL